MSLNSTSGSFPSRIHPRCGSTGPPIHSGMSLPPTTGGSRRTMSLAATSLGRFNTRPNAPSGL
jgi:hypothetical protein